MPSLITANHAFLSDHRRVLLSGYRIHVFTVSPLWTYQMALAQELLVCQSTLLVWLRILVFPPPPPPRVQVGSTRTLQRLTALQPTCPPLPTLPLWVSSPRMFPDLPSTSAGETHTDQLPRQVSLAVFPSAHFDVSH